MKVLSLLLALCLLLTTPALAVQDGASPFQRSKTYTRQFSDLPAGSVFYSNVAALYEYGLTVGQGDGTYGVDGSMTVGQVMIFAGRIRSLYRTGSPETGPAAWPALPGQHPAVPYLRYLQAEGVLDRELDGLLALPATRAQVAHVLAGTLPEEVLPSVHTDLVTRAYASRRFIPDVTEYTPYYQDILSLYRRGLSVGIDARGSFLPDAPISRGAVAALLTRMVDPSLRVAPAWDTSAPAATTLADLVPPGTYRPAPANEAELAECLRHMLSSGKHILTLQYPSLSAVEARKLMSQALRIVKSYCEQSYNSVSCTLNNTGGIELTFSAIQAGDQLPLYRRETMTAALAVREQLWDSGQLTSAMTQTEVARVYYTWICDNCVYDAKAGDQSLSHIPYRLFHDGTAVCDGYTGAYNLLLKLEDIDCTALSNDSHIWTVATLDGVQVHIDTTWGDSSGTATDYRFFAMTPQQSWWEHTW